MRSLQYAIYKGKNKTGGVPSFGAAQFNLADAHHYCDTCKEKNYKGDWHPTEGTSLSSCKGKMLTREGCVFVEITSAKAPDVYDWDNKIIMALSVTDLSKLLLTLRTGVECKLFHDPGAGSEKMGAIKKTFNVQSPKGIENGCMIYATMTNGTDNRKHTVPLSSDECCALGLLVAAAVPRCLNWL